MLWVIVLGTAYGKGEAFPDTLIDPNVLTEEEKEILRLWDESVRELERSSSPFTVPIPKGDENSPNYGQATCSASCAVGSCSVSCYGAVICGCTSTGLPVCRCKSDSVSSSKSKDYPSPSIYGKKMGDIKVSTIPGRLEIIPSPGSPVREVGIWDVSGRLVTRLTLKGKKTIHLKRGIYFVKVGHLTRKVIVR